MQKTALKQWIVILLVVAGLVIAFRVMRSRPWGPSALDVAVSELRSTAAEGHLLSRQIQAGELTDNFRRVHVEMIVQETEQTRKALLEHPIKPELEGARARAAELALQLISQLSLLSSSSQAAGSTFGSLKGELDALHSQLQ